MAVDGLIELFSFVLKVDASSLDDDSSPETVPTWDSLAAMVLVTEIESKFNVQLSTKEIMKMATIGLARQSLRNKGIDI
ncbi:acyl carrier protein [Deltaproteobacteria bacterium]|nr:acyl carrier protein [Deltaproteobacteria bacterium]